MPQITVVVPVYNVKDYLPRCINSISAQTFTDFDLALIDDGSPDECGSFCDEFALQDQRIISIHQTNGGLSAARNSGIDWAQCCSNSQWISFVDSDDWIKIDYLSNLLKAAVNNKADISCSSYVALQSDGKTISWEYPLPNEVLSSAESLQKLADKHWPWYNQAWGKLYKKELLSHIHFPTGKNYEDVFVMHKLFYCSNALATISNADYCYYLSQTSIMRSAVGIKNLVDIEAFCERYDFYLKHGYYEECHLIFDTLHYKYEDYLLKIRPINREDRKRIKTIRKRFVTIYRNEKGNVPIRSRLRYTFPELYKLFRRIVTRT